MNRKRRKDAGTRRPGSPEVDDVVISFRINPDRDKAAWDTLQYHLQQGYSQRTIWLWALLNASGVPTDGPAGLTNGLPQASLDYLRDSIIDYLEQHQLTVAVTEETSTPAKRGKKVSKDDRAFFKRLLSGFDDNDEDE